MYKIWSEKGIRNIRVEMAELPGVFLDGIVEVLETANEEHHKAMSEKDIEIAGLKGYIKGLEKS